MLHPQILKPSTVVCLWQPEAPRRLPVLIIGDILAWAQHLQSLNSRLIANVASVVMMPTWATLPIGNVLTLRQRSTEPAFAPGRDMVAANVFQTILLSSLRLREIIIKI